MHNWGNSTKSSRNFSDYFVIFAFGPRKRQIPISLFKRFSIKILQVYAGFTKIWWIEQCSDEETSSQSLKRKRQHISMLYELHWRITVPGADCFRESIFVVQWCLIRFWWLKKAIRFQWGPQITPLGEFPNKCRFYRIEHLD